MAFLAKPAFASGWYRGYLTGNACTVESVKLELLTQYLLISYRLFAQKHILLAPAGKPMLVTYGHLAATGPESPTNKPPLSQGDDNSALTRPRITSHEGFGVRVWSTQAGQNIALSRSHLTTLMLV